MLEKLETAIHKMNPGDRFKPSTGKHTVMTMTGAGAIKRVDTGEFIRLSKQTLSIEGEIIPAEPEVLTAEEWLNKRREMYQHPHGFTWHDKDLLDACEFFQQNGRLEMYNEFKEYLKELKKGAPTAFLDTFDYIIKNIKPLNSDAKERSN